MADMKLPVSGRELDIDLHQIKRREFTRMVDNQISDAEACAIMAKAVGLEPAEVEALSMIDWRALFLALIGKGMEPLAVPNSASASTSG